MKIKNAKFNAALNGLTEIHLLVEEAPQNVSSLIYDANTKPHELIIKPVSVKRSLTQNAYYWVLVEKLAAKLGISRTEAHTHLLSEYGVTDQDAEGNNRIFSVKDGIEFSIPGMYIEPFAEGYVDGIKFIHYRVLKGSSEMNTQEFKRLIDGLIYECKAQDIETLTPSEIERLKRI